MIEFIVSGCLVKVAANILLTEILIGLGIAFLGLLAIIFIKVWRLFND